MAEEKELPKVWKEFTRLELIELRERASTLAKTTYYTPNWKNALLDIEAAAAHLDSLIVKSELNKEPDLRNFGFTESPHQS